MAKYVENRASINVKNILGLIKYCSEIILPLNLFIFDYQLRLHEKNHQYNLSEYFYNL